MTRHYFLSSAVFSIQATAPGPIFAKRSELHKSGMRAGAQVRHMGSHAAFSRAASRRSTSRTMSAFASSLKLTCTGALATC